MTYRMERRAYAETYGPTVGDKIRLADTIGDKLRL